MWSPLLVLALTVQGRAAQEVVVELPEGMRPADLRGPHIGFSEGGTGRARHLQVDAEGLAHLNRLGLSWTDVPRPPDSVPDGYHTPNEMVEALEALADQYPARVTLAELGRSREGRPLLGALVSNTETPTAIVRVLAAHHGDELISGEAALDLVATLATATDAPWLDTMALWVVPHVNPDGVAIRQRANAAAVDLNRNYAFEWSDAEFQAGAAPFSEPETRMVEALALRGSPVLSLSLHSGAANFGWVWNYTLDVTSDEAHHRAIGERYAASCTTPGFWITNGAAWYPTNGDTNDWSYGSRGGWDYTLELSVDKTPPADELADRLDQHRAAMIGLFADTPLRTGQLVDGETGRPLRGSVTRQPDGQPFRTADDGRFAQVDVGDGMGFMAHAPGYGPSDLPAEHRGAVELWPTTTPGAVDVWPPVVASTHNEPIQLTGPTDRVTVSAPGRPSFSPPSTASFDLNALSAPPPGLWTIAEGAAPPSTWLLVDAADAPGIRARMVSGSTLELELARGAPGREAWIYVDGQLDSEQPILHSDPVVSVALASVRGAGRVDVAVHGPGGPVWVAQVFDGAWTTMEKPPGTGWLDTGLSSMPGEPTACGCTSTPWSPVAVLWPLVLGLTRRRRP